MFKSTTKRQQDFFVDPTISPFTPTDFPAKCATLDILTPWYQIKFKTVLSEGEQHVMYAMFEQRANYPIGFPFPSSCISVNAVQKTRSHISAVLACLVNKKVLARVGSGQYRLRNPGLELWMRCRNLDMRDYAPLYNALCPVLMADQDLTHEEFWSRICIESGTDLAISPRRRSPERITTQ